MYAELIAYTDAVRSQYAEFIAHSRAKLAGSEVACEFDRRTAAELAALIGERIEAREPFALMRLGDGEGACLLDIEEEFPDLYRAVLARTLGLHFGPRDYTLGDFAFWRNSIDEAISHADVLACPTLAICQPLLDEPPADIRGTVGVIGAAAHLVDRRGSLAARLFEGGHAHLALLPHYAGLLRGRRVNLVTCYGEGWSDRLARAFDCAVEGVTVIPGQAVNEKQGLAAPLYPGEYDRIVAEIAARAEPGVVWLVAAGLAGKAFCAIAAAGGAVALDVGSVMDVWYGRGVRPYQTSAFVEKHAL